MLTRLLTAVFATTVVLIPASADAATYCVAVPSCPKTDVQPTLQAALAASDASVEIDTIKLGSGTFAGHFQNAADRPVRIEGSTTTTLSPDTTTDPGLWLRGKGSTLKSVSVSFGAGKQHQLGLRLSDGAAASYVSASADPTAQEVQGFELGAGASLSNAVVDFKGIISALGVRVTGAGATVLDTSVRATGDLLVEADATIRRARFDEGSYGVRIVGGTVNLENVVVDQRDGLGVGVLMDGGQAQLDGATIVGGNSFPAMVDVAGGELVARDSIVTGGKINGWVAFDHVVRDPGATVTGTDVAPIVGKPEFVLTGKDPFQLVAGSPLIDTGSDRPGGTDMAGAPRLADGDGDCTPHRDPGAYEAATKACTVPADPVPAQEVMPVDAVTAPPAVTPAPPAVLPVAVVAKVSKVKVTRTKLTFTASAPAKVKITIKRSKKTVKTLTRQARAGANTVKLRLPKGRYSARIAVG